ncbi:hypothetical protein LCGC14_2458280 [marine sediment metagenome]|uniref:Ice-binding protein C-terminal domain-containing protein n=1 Tax=marine sediment metagenome TaxID=412755 RepID=A0A0F9C1P6_9ZZZZ
MPGVRYILLFIACLAVFTAGANASIIEELTPYYDETPEVQTFNDFFTETPIADIQSNVYYYSSEEYLYTYQITSNHDLDLGFVTMQIYNVFGATDYWKYDDTGDSEEVNPAVWGPFPFSSPSPDSFDGHFNDPIASSAQSALLWFVTSDEPTNAGKGSLFGVYRTADGDPWSGFYAEGNLITPDPVPEPATFLLISMGTFAIIGRRRGTQEGV